MRIFKWFFWILVLIFVSVFSIDLYISKYAQADIYSDVNNVPYKKAAMVLGTSKYMIGGGKNYY